MKFTIVTSLHSLMLYTKFGLNWFIGLREEKLKIFKSLRTTNETDSSRGHPSDVKITDRCSQR